MNQAPDLFRSTALADALDALLSGTEPERTPPFVTFVRIDVGGESHPRPDRMG